MDRLELDFNMLPSADFGFFLDGRIDPGNVTTHMKEGRVKITILHPQGPLLTVQEAIVVAATENVKDLSEN